MHFDYLVAEEAKKIYTLESLSILHNTKNPLTSNWTIKSVDIKENCT